MVAVHPYPPPPPQPPQRSFFEQEIGGVPLYVHLMAVLVSCGVYLVILPFVLLFDAIQKRIDRAVDRVVGSVVDRILKAALVVVAIPAYLVYELGRWIHRRWFAKPASEVSPAPAGDVDGGAGHVGGER
ncbi:hypothetical protein Ait01nite_035320 [Actinoplanes italicus]|nr:hypothetical protein Ait01nite_035320 [Actinoplanes italicus]